MNLYPLATDGALVIDISMTIGGQRVNAAGTLDVLNPATGDLVASVPDCDESQLNSAMAAARSAWPAWRNDLGRRREALRAMSAALDEHRDELAALLTAEQGKPLHEAAEEIDDSRTWINYYADLDDPIQVIQDDMVARIEVHRRPLGVVAAITPWNFPLTLANWKIAPALLAGNTVVLKPSPYTPVATLRLGELLQEILPAGVLNVVSGRDHLGPLMTNHPTPRKVSFTGSVATGKHVAASAANDLKRITLELGGNDPAILLDDVDIDAIAGTLFWRAFENNGQVCSAVKRVYAPASRYDEVVDALSELASKVTVGNGANPGTNLGPLNNEPQLNRVAELVDAAVADGARAVTGGHRIDGPGYFYAPTIVAGATDGMRLVDEEQFGPALPVIKYDDVETVVASINSSTFGLCGSVWGVDEDRASEVASRLEVGTAWTNTHLAFQPDQPFGGAKWSGVGLESGIWGLHGFSDVQVLHRAR